MSDWAERRSDALVREWQARQTPPDTGIRWWLRRRIAAELRAVAARVAQGSEPETYEETAGTGGGS
jgi:hypothetical protein